MTPIAGLDDDGEERTLIFGNRGTGGSIIMCPLAIEPAVLIQFHIDGVGSERYIPLQEFLDALGLSFTIHPQAAKEGNDV